MENLCTIGDQVGSMIILIVIAGLVFIVAYSVGVRSGQESGYRQGFRVARTRYSAIRNRDDLES
jgi:hypothetical protein